MIIINKSIIREARSVLLLTGFFCCIIGVYRGLVRRGNVNIEE